MDNISKEARAVLIEIIENEDNSQYWKNRFDNIFGREDIILRGCFKELKKKELIDTKWADDYPYIISVFKEGYSYYERIQKGYDKIIKFEDKITNAKYDVFISHANKDKLDFIDGLYESLSRLGINIFYDKKSLEWGDKWKDRILDGVQRSEFAIIIISENFFDREWTEKELNEFLNRQNENGQKIILPVVHNITISQLSEKYPSIAEIQAINSGDYTYDQIALLFASQLIKRLKV